MLDRPTALAVSTLLAGALVLVPTSVASANGETCHGRDATIVGTGPALSGTPGDDVIVSGTSTAVDAGAGNDLVCVSEGPRGLAFHLDAGPGDDVVDASLVHVWSSTVGQLGTGRDRYIGSPGADFLRADNADDDVSTGSSRDIVEIRITDKVNGFLGRYDGGPHYNTLIVKAERSDVVVDLDGPMTVSDVTAAHITAFTKARLSARRAVLRGSAEDNHLFAQGCKILVDGDGGNDEIAAASIPQCGAAARTAVLSGGEGDDVMKGSAGSDRLAGGAGSDELDGRGDGDRLIGGPGRDRITGGDGSDVLLGNGASDTLQGGRGRDRADGKAGRDDCVAETERDCER